MKKLTPAAIRCSLMFTAVAALSLAYPASVHAVPTTYRYTGNPFTFARGSYTRSDFVTVMFTLAGPLPPNMPLTSITPFTYTVSDGVQTFPGTVPDPFALFKVATGPAGGVTRWEIRAGDSDEGRLIQTIKLFRGETPTDSGWVNHALISSANNSQAPGTWTRAPSVADYGSTISIMTLTLMALGVVARRFQRAAG